MIQKVLRVGSSAAVTIPKRTMSSLGIKVGDKVRIQVEPLAKIDRELADWTESFIKRYRPALEELAKK